jgi:hypothetical protein
LLVGGKTDALQRILSTTALASTEIYNPQSGTFSPSGNLSSPRTGHTATLLSDGTVLGSGGANSAVLASTEIYNPPSGQFVAGPNMTLPRTNHTATTMPDGTVLVIIGIPEVPAVYVGYAPTPTAEIYNLGSKSFLSTASLTDGLFWHSATLLLDGRVLVVGGGHSNAPGFGVDSVTTAEVYH